MLANPYVPTEKTLLNTMEKFFTQTTKLFASESYLQRVSELTDEPVTRIRQAHHLLTTLLIACLLKQLLTDIGRGLVYNLAVKRSLDTDDRLAITDTDLTMMADRGDKLFNRIIPGKKSAVVRITAYYTKLPFASIYPVLGLCADALFTDIYYSVKQQAVAKDDLYGLLPAPIELRKLAPELAAKDYETIGVRSLMLQA